MGAKQPPLVTPDLIRGPPATGAKNGPRITSGVTKERKGAGFRNGGKLRNFTRDLLFAGAISRHSAKLCGPDNVGQRILAGWLGHNPEQIMLVGVLDDDVDDVAGFERCRDVAQIDMSVDLGRVGL